MCDCMGTFSLSLSPTYTQCSHSLLANYCFSYCSCQGSGSDLSHMHFRAIHWISSLYHCTISLCQSCLCDAFKCPSEAGLHYPVTTGSELLASELIQQIRPNYFCRIMHVCVCFLFTFLLNVKSFTFP